MDIIKVAATSRSTAVAGAIAGVMREKGQVDVQAIGAGAVNQATKAVIIARGYLELDGDWFLKRLVPKMARSCGAGHMNGANPRNRFGMLKTASKSSWTARSFRPKSSSRPRKAGGTPKSRLSIYFARRGFRIFNYSKDLHMNLPNQMIKLSVYWVLSHSPRKWS